MRSDPLLRLWRYINHLLTYLHVSLHVVTDVAYIQGECELKLSVT